MAPCEITDDYYALLEVPQTASLEIIRKSYLRLAVALHPDRNLNKPTATASFQRVSPSHFKSIIMCSKAADDTYCKLSSAYETISDPCKRRAYDIQWVSIKNRHSTQQEAKRRQAEAAETERKRAAEETLNQQREQRAYQERLRPLEQSRSGYNSDIFEINRVIRRLAADLKRLQDQDDEESKKEKQRNSWWTYFTSPIYGKAEETEEQKQQRETQRLQRLNCKRIKDYELNQKKANLQRLESALQDVESKIIAEKKNEDRAQAQAAKRQEQLRKEEEARRRSEEEQQERERQARREAAMAKLRREQAARAAKEARDAEEAREAEERVRRAQAAREAQESQQRARAAEAAAARRRKASKPSATTTSKNSSYRASTTTTKKNSTCQHGAFWPQLQGSHLCTNCQTVQRRFAFQCPGCTMIACANCRRSLRGERGRNGRTGGRLGYNTSSDDDPNFWDNDYFD